MQSPLNILKFLDTQKHSGDIKELIFFFHIIFSHTHERSFMFWMNCCYLFIWKWRKRNQYCILARWWQQRDITNIWFLNDIRPTWYYLWWCFTPTFVIHYRFITSSLHLRDGKVMYHQAFLSLLCLFCLLFSPTADISFILVCLRKVFVISTDLHRQKLVYSAWQLTARVPTV